MAKVDMVMPQMGESITEGTIIKWLKKEGETVEKDEILLEISTDKVDSEIPSPHSGSVSKLLASEGDTVEVGSVIAHLESDVAAAPQAEAQPQPEPESKQQAQAPEPAPEQAKTAEQPVSEPVAASGPAQAGGTVDMVMPQMGESITEGTVIRWLKKEGDTVSCDEIILEISTDKVDSEIPSPHEGKIIKLLVKEGDTVAVGSAIAQIASESTEAAAPSETATTPKPEPEAKKQDMTSSEPTPTTPAPTSTPTASITIPANQQTNGERRFYSPLVRRIARSEGVSVAELANVSGTGAHGRVTKKDILNYLDARHARPASGAATAVPAPPPQVSTPAGAAASAPPVAPASSDDRTEVFPMDSMRKAIASHMVASVKTSPHVFAVSEADLTNIVAFRSRNKEAFLQKAGTKLTYMPFITMACAKALQDYPMVNASVDGTNIIRKKYINVGIAVALENNGLIVPVVKNADELNIVGLARAINDLAERARIKKLKPDEVQDGTFSITNMGSFGSLMGLPIINQPQVAILGIGTIQKRPVVINDAIAIRSMMYISLSFDHRIVDGALAGQYLERVAHYLTNFDTKSVL